MKARWQANLLVASVTAFIWLVIFLCQLFYRVPHKIREEANTLREPQIVRRISAPSFWDSKTKTPGQPLPPLIKRGRLDAAIPFAVYTWRGEPSEAIIPNDVNIRDPLLLTYNELAGVASIPLGQQFDPLSRTWITVPPPTNAVARDFIGRVLQYYLLRAINLMEYPLQSVNYSQGKGSTVNQPHFVSVPDEDRYPSAKLVPLWSQLGTRFRLTAGQNDWVWEPGHELKVPKHTVVSVSEGPDVYIVRFERKADFYLDFKISPGSLNSGLPAHFQPSDPQNIQNVNCYFVTISLDFKWDGKDRYSSESYADWAEGLFEEL